MVCLKTEKVNSDLRHEIWEDTDHRQYCEHKPYTLLHYMYILVLL